MTYNEDQLAAAVADAVAKAVAPLQVELDAARATVGATETAKAVEDAVTPVKAELADLHAKHDIAVAENAALKQAATAAEEQQRLADQAKTDAEAAAARRDGRIEQLKQTGCPVTDEMIAESGDRWAAMEDADFTATLGDFQNLAAGLNLKPPAPGAELPPNGATAMTAAAVTTGGDGPTSPGLKGLASLWDQGVDPRNVNR